MKFVMPATTVKKSPSIRDVMLDPTPVAASQPQPQQPQPQLPQAAPTTEAMSSQTQPAVAQEITEQKNAAKDSKLVFPAESLHEAPSANEDTAPDPTAPPTISAPVNPDDDRDTFQIFWEKLTDDLFADCPTLLSPLKSYVVTRNGNVFTIPVKNDFQLHDLNLRKSLVLKYLRDNLDPSIEDVEVQLVTNMETKRIILLDSDKMNVLREQNPDIVDFLHVLNLQVKN